MNEKTKNVQEFIKGLINADMSKEEIDKHEQAVKLLDEIDKDFESKDKEIRDCKDKIVSLIKTEGSSDTPQEEKKPRSLEEIAKSIASGGK